MHARVFFIKARAANKAVVFRHGPTKWIQMIVWDLDNDTFEFGQWIKKKVRIRRCDISPSGEYLIYLIDNGEYLPSRTIISRPPYWTAVASWEIPEALFGSGGGLFDDENSIILNWHNPENIISDTELLLPPSLNISVTMAKGDYNLWKGQIHPLLDHRLQREGWVEEWDNAFVAEQTSRLIHRKTDPFGAKRQPESRNPIAPKLWKKVITNSAALYRICFYHSEHRKNHDLFYVGKKDKKTKLEGISWADTDDRNRIIATKEGLLYASKLAGDGSVDYTALELITDLNPQEPKRVLTPENRKHWK